MPICLGRLFGTHIRALREARRLTQEARAERSDLSMDTIPPIERGTLSAFLNTLGGS